MPTDSTPSTITICTERRSIPSSLRMPRLRLADTFYWIASISLVIPTTLQFHRIVGNWRRSSWLQPMKSSTKSLAILRVSVPIGVPKRWPSFTIYESTLMSKSSANPSRF